MRPRSYALFGALALVLAGAVIAMVLIPRHGSAPRPQAVTEAPPTAETEKTLSAAKPVTTPKPTQPAPKTAQPAAPAKPAATKPLPSTAPAKPDAALEAPFLRIDSPAAGSLYRSSLVLAGRITDTERASTARSIESAAWSIAGTERTGQLKLSATGSFRAEVPTEGLHDGISLVVSAQKKGGGFAEKTVAVIEDTRGPSISIASPRGQTTYGSSVTVSGRVSGPHGVAGSLSEISSVAWAIDGTSVGGPVQVSRDGAFTVSFSTIGMNGDIAMSLVATDRNGHTAQATLSLKDRAAGPSLRIDAPADESEYGAIVNVSGTVGDQQDPSGAPSEVKSFSWRVIGMPKLSGDLPLSNDGAYRLSFSTAGISGPAVLELQALDRNGRSTSRTLTLVPPAAASTSTASPALSLTVPLDNSIFGSTVTVAGTVATAASDPVTVVAWSIAGTALSGSAAVDADGRFTFPVKMTGRSEEHTSELQSPLA
jgi:hypothetical protein